MKKIKSYLLLFTITFFVSTHSFAQITSAEVDALVTNAMKQFNVAGVAVAIVKDGKIVHEKGYGVKSINTKIAVDEHTNFQIASNSKAFTTAALSILVDEGKISWKDKVVKYIPELKMYNDYVTQNFLIEDLLCHRSGMGLGVGDLNSFPDGSDFTIKDVLSSFQYFKAESPFRTQYDYDNQLFYVAGELLERVTGTTWENFIRTRIMDPLQMTNTLTSPKEIKDMSALAMPHSTEGSAKNEIRQFPLFQGMLHSAAGNILSNVDDMSKWMIMQLNGGKYGENLENQIFSSARQREMWRIHTVFNSNPNPRYNTHFAGYGLGWVLSDMKGNMSVSHTGGLPGMLSKVNLIPDMKLGIVILTNTETGGGALFNAVNNTILDSYLGLDKVDYVEKYSKSRQIRNTKADSIVTAVWKQVDASKKAKITKSDFVGIYEDNWFGKIEVFMKGNQLWFKSYRSPKLTGPMSFYKANTFAIKWDYQDMICDAFAMFNLDENGKAQSIKMKGISPNIDFSYDFQDLDLVRVGE